MAEYCVVRQRAGPLVKTYTTDRKRFVEWAKRSDMGRLSAPCMWAKSADKLELYLALFGYTGTHYILTFDDEHLPDSFDGVKRCLAAFIKRARRMRPMLRRYVYAIEVGHSGGRWHIHFVADDSDLPFDVARYLWRYGWVNPGYVKYPVLHKEDGYRRLAEYICKDRDGGFVPLGKHKWGVERGVRVMIPCPETSFPSLRPAVPLHAFWARAGGKEMRDPITGKSFGYLYKASWVAAKR